MSKVLLVIVPTNSFVTGDIAFALLHADTGEFLASHICSSRNYAYGDLYGHRPERQERWKSRFGEIEVKHLDDTDISISDLISRNKEWYLKTNHETDQSKRP